MQTWADLVPQQDIRLLFFSPPVKIWYPTAVPGRPGFAHMYIIYIMIITQRVYIYITVLSECKPGLTWYSGRISDFYWEKSKLLQCRILSNGNIDFTLNVHFYREKYQSRSSSLKWIRIYTVIAKIKKSDQLKSTQKNEWMNEWMNEWINFILRG